MTTHTFPSGMQPVDCRSRRIFAQAAVNAGFMSNAFSLALISVHSARIHMGEAVR
jgi:hypothetical protein